MQLEKTGWTDQWSDSYTVALKILELASGF